MECHLSDDDSTRWATSSCTSVEATTPLPDVYDYVVQQGELSTVWEAVECYSGSSVDESFPSAFPNFTGGDLEMGFCR